MCRRQRLGSGQDGNNARSDPRRRHKSAGRYVEQDSHIGDPLDENRKPSVGLAARRGGQALGDLALKHQGQALVVPDLLEPPENEQGGDVVREVRNNLARSLGKRRRVEFERIASDNIKATRINRSKLAERRETTPISFYRKNAARPTCQQRPRQTARAGTDFDDRGLVEPSRRSYDPTRQVEIEKKILTQALVRGDAVSRDDLA